MPVEVTEQVLVREFDGSDTVDLTKYTLYLIGLVEDMNTDRATVQNIINTFNSQGATPKVPPKVSTKG